MSVSDAGVERGARQFLDVGQSAIGLVDIDAGVFVENGLLSRHECVGISSISAASPYGRILGLTTATPRGRMAETRASYMGSSS